MDPRNLVTSQAATQVTNWAHQENKYPPSGAGVKPVSGLLDFPLFPELTKHRLYFYIEARPADKDKAYSVTGEITFWNGGRPVVKLPASIGLDDKGDGGTDAGYHLTECLPCVGNAIASGAAAQDVISVVLKARWSSVNNVPASASQVYLVPTRITASADRVTFSIVGVGQYDTTVAQVRAYMLVISDA